MDHLIAQNQRDKLTSVNELSKAIGPSLLLFWILWL